jgi:hypothetical protein
LSSIHTSLPCPRIVSLDGYVLENRISGENTTGIDRKKRRVGHDLKYLPRYLYVQTVGGFWWRGISGVGIDHFFIGQKLSQQNWKSDCYHSKVWSTFCYRAQAGLEIKHLLSTGTTEWIKELKEIIRMYSNDSWYATPNFAKTYLSVLIFIAMLAGATTSSGTSLIATCTNKRTGYEHLQAVYVVVKTQSISNHKESGIAE